MNLKLSPSLVILGLAVVLWIVPSVGTQGMGTIGQRLTHPDSPLIDEQSPAPSDRETRATLQRADAVAETALGY